MNAPDDVLAQLYATLLERKTADPKSSYVAGLYAKGLDSILKKIGEEATEAVIAAKGTDRKLLIHELADLWFHSLVLMAAKDITPAELGAELAGRMGRSGLEEKAARTK